ncbi:mannose-6-phosphate isomerase, class I [Peribacillus cavernae]|uniref:Mannose-6-phosphate isomerase n=1 Tax=Peribacillus cavernae TaxID=1674310 RepID=A0A433HWM4_9BACI|nr:mannose-6-phosphate isomerase, class I [Peribacillus cavernae]MDQ0218112.1 mannose-6-phosphate isomerase [Peribacillus cavernae]RUQ32732.1 mannose-6-phosphate isomerase, class I [Peribacillus cavernae]
MNQPLFLQPIFQERIWGGTALKERFGYDIPSNHTGECWAISGHPNGQSVVKIGPHSGKTIGELWKNNHGLFGNYPSDVFPLLTKVLDANANLSVQVHPDDDYAKVNENGELGKTECWYIIDCKEDAELVYGHTARTKEELIQQVESGNWNELLRRVKIKPGDFFYVPSGTIHALCEGTLVLETQQSSDTTYRVYDYDRTDQSGKKRELHLKKALEVTAVPHNNVKTETKVNEKSGATITTFVEAEYFSVYKWNISGKSAFKQDKPFMLFSIINGEGLLKVGVETYQTGKGDHFILPADIGEFTLEGTMEIIVSHP